MMPSGRPRGVPNELGTQFKLLNRVNVCTKAYRPFLLQRVCVCVVVIGTLSTKSNHYTMLIGSGGVQENTKNGSI